MKMRAMRKATLVGGAATGALLLAGSAAQAAETQTEEAGLDAVQAVPEVLGGLPVPVDAVPGLDAVQNLPVPGLDETVAQTDGGAANVGSPVDDLLADLGGGLPVPLPF